MSLYRLAFTQAADRDILETVTRSRTDFGTAAADRYTALLTKAFLDLGADPHRPGTRAHPEIGTGIYTYHLAFSRPSRSRADVKSPRHLIAYRMQEHVLTVLRVLHDRRDLRRHIE